MQLTIVCTSDLSPPPVVRMGMCIATLAARRAAIKVSWHQVKNINTKFAMLCLLHKARNYLSIKRITHKVQFQGKWKFSISLEFVNQVKCLTVH